MYHFFGNRCVLRRGHVQVRCRRGLAASFSVSTDAPSSPAPAKYRYIERWHASTVKPQSFYDDFAAREKQKCYFYSVDLRGRLFLEDVLPKNIATSIKDENLLNFIFR